MRTGCIRAATIVIMLAAQASGAVKQEKGTEEGFWDSHAVFVCRFGAMPDGPLPRHYPVTVVAVMATDILVPTDLTLTGAFNVGNSALMARRPLKKGSVAVVCAEKRKNEWSLTHNDVTFLPEGSALTMVNGVEDKQVAAIAVSVKAVREKAQRKKLGIPERPEDVGPVSRGGAQWSWCG